MLLSLMWIDLIEFRFFFFKFCPTIGSGIWYIKNNLNCCISDNTPGQYYQKCTKLGESEMVPQMA